MPRPGGVGRERRREEGKVEREVKRSGEMGEGRERRGRVRKERK